MPDRISGGILEPDAVYLADRKSYGGDLDGFSVRWRAGMGKIRWQ